MIMISRTIILGLSWMFAFACLQAQSFKESYRIDTNTLASLGGLNVRDLVSFDGNKLAMAGAISGPDTSGWYRQSAYVLQVDDQGVVIRYDEFEDNSQFVFQGPVVFGLCNDGQGSFYTAMGSNSRQVVMKSGQSGSFEWAKAQHHHEFYDIHCTDTLVTFLGQDESVQGLHDFSISQLDPTGNGGFGYMYGTPDFESPERLVPLNGGGFLLVGTTNSNGVARPMMIRLDASLQMVWGKIYEDTLLGRHLTGKAVFVENNFNRILLAGIRQAENSTQTDSLAVMRFDSSGNFMWAKLYGHPDWTYASLVDMEVGALGDVFLAANVRDTGYQYPVLVRLAPDGQFVQGLSFDDHDPATEETVQALTWTSSGLYGAGEKVTVLPNFQMNRELFLFRQSWNSITNCEDSLFMGVVDFQLAAGGTILAQPYQIADSFPFRHHDGVVHHERTCYVPVGVDEAFVMQPALKFQNPASGQLKVWYDFPSEAGVLEIMDLNGSLRCQSRVATREGETILPLNGYASGLYLIRAHGQGWSTTVEKLLILGE